MRETGPLRIASVPRAAAGKPQPARGVNHPSSLRTAILAALLSFVVYNANARLISTGDSIPARLIPFSILLDGTVTLDRFFRAEYEQTPPAERPARFYYLRPSHGRLYSAYPITLPLLITPLYAPVVVAKRHWTTAEILHAATRAEKLAASLIASLSVAVMYLLLAAMAERRTALVLTAAFAFGTTTWTTSSQALWQHGAGVLFILLTLLVLARHPGRLWLAGAFAALAVAVRPTNVFFWLAAVTVVTVMAVPGRTRAVRAVEMALPGLLIGGALAAYNLTSFGDVRGGYGGAPFTPAVAQGLAGILASPSRGLFVYSPVLLFGVAGGWLTVREWRRHPSPVLATAAVFVVLQVFCIAAWPIWWGGWSYGPRLLTEAAAGLVVLSVPALTRLGRHRWERVAFGASLAYSVAVQALGAVAYEKGRRWDQYPVSVDQRPERLWDWRDSQIRRTAEALLGG